MNSQSRPLQETQLSFEFFPPKDAAGEDRLWATLESLAGISPDFVSVTYGAGGSTRDRTIRITSEITAKTGIPTVSHLTCVGSTRDELETILRQYKEAGIHRVLALRGDPPGGPRERWVPTENGFDHAEQLVALSYQMGFDVGVAVFPDGHPASQGRSQDIETLARKVAAGATFAISQFFFDIDSWKRLLDEVSERDLRIELIPGIMPVTNVKQLIRFAELSGTAIPEKIRARFERVADNPDHVHKVGIDVATELGQQLLDIGSHALHFFTLNTSPATREVVANLGIRR